MVTSLCFSSSGWAFIYYLGIAKFLQDNFDLSETKFLGVSGGCIPCLLLCLNYNIDSFFSKIKPIAEFCNNGIMTPTLYCEQVINEVLYLMPKNLCNIIKNKVYFSATKLPWFENELINEFNDIHEVKQAMICSCYSPIFFPNMIASYRDNYYMDGMASNDSPQIDENTVQISAFFNKDIKNDNRYLMMTSCYYPGNIENIQKMFNQGYIDGIDNIDLFIKKNFKLKYIVVEKKFTIIEKNKKKILTEIK